MKSGFMLAILAPPFKVMNLLAPLPLTNSPPAITKRPWTAPPVALSTGLPPLEPPPISLPSASGLASGSGGLKNCA